MSKTKTLAYFYSNSGIFYHPLVIPTDCILFLKSTIALGLISLGYFMKNKFGSIAITIIGCIISIIIVANDSLRVFGFLPILLLILTVIAFKKLTPQIKILAISTLLVCFKVFWVLLIGSYGNFYIPIAVVGSLVLIFQFLPRNMQKYFAIYLLVVASVLFCNNFKAFLQTQYKINTLKGEIFTRTTLGKSSNELIRYIDENTNPTDRIIIAPEGMTINFLTERKSDDFYNSLLPLYFETFTQERFIENYSNSRPEYIILTNHSTRDYYFEYICQDYALDFCQFIQKNYELKHIIDNQYRFIIFKAL